MNVEGIQKVTQVYVFDGDDYLGWDCFEKGVIHLGTSPDADVLLDDEALQPLHARIRPNGAGAILEALGLNGELVETRKLGPLDTVTFGRFTLKVRVKARKGANGADGGLRAVEVPPIPSLFEEIVENGRRQPPSETIAPKGADGVSTSTPQKPEFELRGQECMGPREPAADDDPPSVDSGLPPIRSFFQEILENAREQLHSENTLRRVEDFPVLAPEVSEPAPRGTELAEAPPLAVPAEPVRLDFVSEVVSEGRAVSGTTPYAEPPEGSAGKTSTESPKWLEDGGPEVGAGPEGAAVPCARVAELAVAPTDRVLEVVRMCGRTVVEVRLLAPGDVYEVSSEGRPIPVAENRDGLWYYADGTRRTASVLAKNGRLVPLPGGSADVRGLCPMPGRGKVVLADGEQEFVLRAVPAPRREQLPPPVGVGRFLRKSLYASVGLHVFVVLLGALSSVFAPAPAPKSEPVVVELEPPSKPLPPPKFAPEPPRPPRSKETVRLTDSSKAVAATPRAQTSDVPRESHAAAETAAAPVAASAGGSAEGAPAAAPVAAAPPRDVRQSGILRALGVPKGVSLGPSVAMAAVGDVAVPTGATDSGVKVGTLVAKLGKTQVGVSAGGAVSTKGSGQVLTGGGTGSGSGSGGTVVGALEKGQTGQRQVRALVSTDVKRSASVQGGMSREEVKKVIDQHMDEVTYCYETSLVESPSLMGKMTLEWRIQTAGTVGEVSIQSSTLRSDSLHACIKRAIKSWQFPKPRGAEVIVSYPFIFDVVGF